VNDLMLLLLGIYALVGAGVALLLIRGGTAPWAAAAAVFAWPLMLPGARPDPAPGEAQGPLHASIEAAFSRLEDAIRHSPGPPPDWKAGLATLRASLLRADERLAIADRILAEPAGEGLQSSVLRRHERRQATATQIAAVLDEIGRLRLQLGLVALDGEALPLREAMQQLLQRARALDEVEQLTRSE
jgi:hypothetical protein